MKKVLFVCVENSCRSQIAEGFAHALGEGVIEAYSTGSRPSGKVNPDAVKVMAEAGVDISGQQSKGIQDLPVKAFDWVITMGCGDACPVVPAKEHQDWGIRDPKGKGMEFFRDVREDIRDKVEHLIEHVRLSK